MAEQNWRRVLGLGWAMGLGCALCTGCGQSQPLGGPVAIVVNRLDTPPAAATKAADEAEPAAIYDEKADGKQLIAAALEEARLNGRHVLIEWGGNWCGWCRLLHDVFTHDELVQPIVSQEYQLVLIDSTANRELMESYGAGNEGYPHLTVLDVDGKVLTNQETGALEDGPKHDPQKVADFLKKWQPPAVDAEDQLAAALRQANDQDKRVLVHVGTPHCVWCKVLTRFLDQHKAILSLDYVDLRIDTIRMQHGEEVEARLMPNYADGVPWMVILDASGKVLATSVGPSGNIGYPGRPEEIDHFIAMLAGTKQRLTDQDLQQIRADLDTFRDEYEKRQTARRE